MSRVPTARIRLKISLKSNADLHVAWLMNLSQNLDKYYKSKFAINATADATVDEARRVVDEEIYSIGKETGSIRRSFQAEVDKEEGTVTTYSEPSIAPSKKAGNVSFGEFSYAAFFEQPVKWNSFIGKLLPPLHEKRYRPFFDRMTRLIHEQVELDAHRAIEATIRKGMPK